MKSGWAPTGYGLALALAVTATGAAWAHHGWSSYDGGRLLTLAGAVEEARFEHPHVTVRVRADGRVWLVILPPPTRAAAAGLSLDLLGPGVRVSVEGYPHRREPLEVRALGLVVGDRVFRLR